MCNRGFLVLENGLVFEGEFFGARGDVVGELVFTTSMVGFLETLTDPSYCGQIVLQTFPLVGNYGVIASDFESDVVGASAYIVKYPCYFPSNFRSEGRIDDFLRKRNIVGLCNVDTRALTRVIRNNGVMNGKIMGASPSSSDFSEIKSYKVINSVERVSTKDVKFYNAYNSSSISSDVHDTGFASCSRYRVALVDFGFKKGILRELLKRNCDVWVFPHNSSLDDILRVKPDGIMLSNGPGDPADNIDVLDNIRDIATSDIPIFGICLGHQLLALAHGFKSHKLKYGHRGSNQPVKDLLNSRVYITSQNHGYAVLSDSIDVSLACQWFVNVNDKTCEGILYKNSPAFSVQFHPEASAGPLDTTFLFDKFIDSLKEGSL